MERCKGDFYVSLVRNLRFSRPSCTFSAWETYGSASGNVECGSRFVSLCRWILLFLCGDVSGGKLKNIKTKKRLSQNRVEMASFVLFQIEVIWIFLKKRSLQTYFFHSNCFLLV